MDARLRHDPLWLAPIRGAAAWPRACRAARDELLWREDIVRRWDDPRHRRRDRHPGAADRGGRWGGQRGPRYPHAVRVRHRIADVEPWHRAPELGQLRVESDPRAAVRLYR